MACRWKRWKVAQKSLSGNHSARKEKAHRACPAKKRRRSAGSVVLREGVCVGVCACGGRGRGGRLFALLVGGGGGMGGRRAGALYARKVQLQRLPAAVRGEGPENHDEKHKVAGAAQRKVGDRKRGGEGG